METDQTPPVGVDSDSPSSNSFIDVGIGAGFEPFGNYFEGAMMIRAEVDSANALAGNDLEASVPENFELKQNYPNPFNPVTKIDFSLISGGIVQVSLYDMVGRKVKDMIDQYMDSGHHSYVLDARGLTSGMYFYSMKVKGQDGSSIFSSTKKLVLLK